MLSQQGQALEGAVIVVGDQFTFTNREGEFLLEGLPTQATGPIHIAAAGHTAWTFDRQSLSRLHTRLRARQVQTRPSITRELTLALPQTLTQERTFYVSVDAGNLRTLILRPGTTRYTFPLSLPEVTSTLSILSPATEEGQEDLWVPPVTIPPDHPNELVLALEPVITRTMDVRLMTEATPWLAQRERLAFTCQDQFTGRATLLGTMATDAEQSQQMLRLFPGPQEGTCRLTWSATIPGDNGPLELVSFVSLRASAPYPAQQSMELPTPGFLSPALEDNTLTWASIPGADLYDVFLAPLENNALGPPIWSASTQSTSLSIPALPPEALSQVDQLEGRDTPFALRVVARFAPGITLEPDLTLAGYYGYLSSPWQLVLDGPPGIWKP